MFTVTSSMNDVLRKAYKYRMLFSRRHSNERDIFRGSCIDVIKTRLRKNLKAPASSRIMPFLKEGDILTIPENQ
jgi:hypothetical protein